MSDSDELLKIVKQFTSLADLVKDLAKEAAPDVEKAVQKTAAAGTTFEGKAWPPREDGARALPNAATAVTAKASDDSILIQLKGPYVFHHHYKGKYRRQILPDMGAGTPPEILQAITDAARRLLAKKLK